MGLEYENKSKDIYQGFSSPSRVSVRSLFPLSSLDDLKSAPAGTLVLGALGSCWCGGGDLKS
ncbi:hypothetical protein PanWU01x14_033610 [Parasponia andersonii]|uniref:Uncharacterized protein n=1 Tax=Parasponia andersonii TaxID=3476 RepID=A0A2P5DTQ3_PARAD|nr:hypothetical protein PanWU01x14_033610 [Parasponia andersonii]